MIPLRDVIPSRSRPVVTVTLIVLNVLAFGYELSLPEATLPTFMRTWGLVPGAFQAHTLLTSLFLHGSWSHLIGNLWYLWIFGDNVEDRCGHGRFLVFYLLTGIVASVGQMLLHPTSLLPTIGASGAIAGVLGAYAVLYPHSRVLTLLPLIIYWDIIELPAVFLLGGWFLLQLISATSVGTSAGMDGGIAFMAHVAGFVAGALGIFVFRRRDALRDRWAD